MSFSLSNYILLVLILLVLLFLYTRMEQKRIREEEDENYGLLQRYLLNDSSSLEKVKKPILWIHIPFEYNARHWISFGSRSSFDLNQPYLFMTVQSIVRECGDSFHICLIDDQSFSKLIPEWEVDLSLISSPVSEKIRALAWSKILYIYGGMLVPISFLCFRDLKPMYESYPHGFIVENKDRNVSATYLSFTPNIHFIGCPRKSPVILEFCRFIENNVSTDFTAESGFMGVFSGWWTKQIKDGRFGLVDGQEVGVKTAEGEPILVEQWLGQDFVDLNPHTFGIWIPAHDILNRTTYEWFARMSPEQVLSSDLLLSRYFVLANKGMRGTLEPLTQRPDWVGFWKVASDTPVWGMRPLNQGDTSVMKLPYPVE